MVIAMSIPHDEFRKFMLRLTSSPFIDDRPVLSQLPTTYASRDVVSFESSYIADIEAAVGVLPPGSSYVYLA